MDKQKLKCFIASAFGRTDVDKIYYKSIKPTLKTINIVPLRIDKINHNDDIDKKIIKLIHQCDFCIADLSFERPSVYYEAGYFNGLDKDVIYIVRKDHLIEKTPGYKVHFDLKMKNIIEWKKPTKNFNKKLLNRIKLVTKPLLDKINDNILIQKQEQEFSQISIHNKNQKIEDSILFQFKQLKFTRLINSDRSYLNKYIYIKNKNIYFFLIISKLLKSDRLVLNSVANEISKQLENKKESIILHYIILSLNKISKSALSSNFSNCDNIDVDNNIWKSNSDNLYVHVIDNIKSVESIQEKITFHLKKRYKLIPKINDSYLKYLF